MILPFKNKRMVSGRWPDIMKKCGRKSRDSRLRQFYQAFPQGHILEDVLLVALDFETTGLNPFTDDIVSIGLVPFDLRRIYCSRSVHWLIHPRRPLAENSIIVHGITHSAISQAPDLLSILEDLLAALSGKIIVVHYNRIEREFLHAALLKRVGEGIRFPVIDTMDIEASLHRKKAKRRWKKRPKEAKKLVSLRLADCRERYGLPPYQAHHALADAMATAELLQAQVAHHYSARTSLAELLV